MQLARAEEEVLCLFVSALLKVDARQNIHRLRRVLVQRAGDVIPEVVKVMAEARDGSEKAVAFPTLCPACGQALERRADEAAVRCVNPECGGRLLQRLIHFAGKSGMDFEGLGKKQVKLLLNYSDRKSVV